MKSKHRDYSNDTIYRIIGAVQCQRIAPEGSFKCVRRAFQPKKDRDNVQR